MRASIQDRTDEFRSVIAQVEKRQASSSRAGAQRRALLTDAQKREANGFANGDAGGAGEGRRARSEFARKAAEIGRGITGTMAKLERLTQRRFSPSSSEPRLMCRPWLAGASPPVTMSRAGISWQWTSHADAALSFCSGQTEDPVRRPAGRDCRVDIHHQARSLVSERADIVAAVAVQVPTHPIETECRCGPGRGAQQERR